MGAEQEVRPSLGQLKYMRTLPTSVDDVGVDIDLSDEGLFPKEESAQYSHAISVTNTGIKSVYIAFDSDAASINIADPLTFNLIVRPNGMINIDGEAEMISLKCAPLTISTIDLIFK